MQGKKTSTARFSGQALALTRSRSDWSRVDATTADEIDAQIAGEKDDWLTDAEAVETSVTEPEAVATEASMAPEGESPRRRPKPLLTGEPDNT